jgi:hypothetical protein
MTYNQHKTLQTAWLAIGELECEEADQLNPILEQLETYLDYWAGVHNGWYAEATADTLIE